MGSVATVATAATLVCHRILLLRLFLPLLVKPNDSLNFKISFVLRFKSFHRLPDEVFDFKG